MAVEYSEIKCQSCNASLLTQGKSQPLRSNVIHCQYCGNANQMSLLKAPPSMGNNKNATYEPLNNAAYHDGVNVKVKPTHVTIDEANGSIKLTFPWHKSRQSSIAALLFVLVWFSIVFKIVFEALGSHSSDSHFNFMLLGVMSIFLFTGMKMLYKTLQNIINVTTIEIGSNGMTLSNGPLLIFGINNSHGQRHKHYRQDEIQSFVSSVIRKDSSLVQIYVELSTGDNEPLLRKGVIQEEANYIIEILNSYLSRK